nr:MAG TPA: WVELL protein [Caudoviricetes sp.]
MGQKLSGCARDKNQRCVLMVQKVISLPLTPCSTLQQLCRLLLKKMWNLYCNQGRIWVELLFV